jgi:hypothetical protein
MYPKLLFIASLLLLGSGNTTYASTITVFNDFGPGNTYQCCQAAPIFGSDTSFGFRAFAMPFTSNNEVNVTQIDLGLTAIGGDAVTVSLDINDGGMLGRTVRSWSLSDLNLSFFGSTNNSVTSITNINGVHLKAGGPIIC